jgi:hypothetical protein
VLGGHIEHSSRLAQDGLSFVFVFVTLDENNPVGFIERKIDPSELSRGRVAEMDHGLSVGGVASGSEEFV